DQKVGGSNPSERATKDPGSLCRTALDASTTRTVCVRRIPHDDEYFVAELAGSAKPRPAFARRSHNSEVPGCSMRASPPARSAKGFEFYCAAPFAPASPDRATESLAQKPE